MLKKVEKTAKNLDEALAQAAADLGAAKDELGYEITREVGKGFMRLLVTPEIDITAWIAADAEKEAALDAAKSAKAEKSEKPAAKPADAPSAKKAEPKRNEKTEIKKSEPKKTLPHRNVQRRFRMILSCLSQPLTMQNTLFRSF